MPRRCSDISQHEEDAPALFPDEMHQSAAPDSASEAMPAIPPAVAYTQSEAIGELQGDLSDPDLPYWLALNRVNGVDPARFRLLLEAFGKAEEAWRASPAAWQAAGLDTRTTASLEQQRRRIVPEAELERLQRLRVGVVRLVDTEYPRLLCEISPSPPLLYIRARLTVEDEWALAVVGTRRVSSYGRQVTERLAGELAAQRITVVSGLGTGIDTFAHTAALEAGGRTIAVLGCGPDLVYPPDNAKLAARILEQGALVTEYPPGTQPEPGNFPARNRLISGLSLGVLVTEAPEQSGALITTRFAAEQGRDVFAVPGNINNRGSVGTNRLIQDGAKLVLAIEDIPTELNLHMAPQQMELREVLPENDLEAQLLALLGATGDPQQIDDLCRASSLPVAQVSGALVIMELKGQVTLVGPMTYVKAR